MTAPVAVRYDFSQVGYTLGGGMKYWILGLVISLGAFSAEAREELDTTYCFLTSPQPGAHLLKVDFKNLPQNKIEVAVIELFQSHFTRATTWATLYEGREVIRSTAGAYEIGTGTFKLRVQRPVPVFESDTPNATLELSGKATLALSCSNLD